LGCGSTYLDDFVNADYYYLRWLPFVKQSSKYDWLVDFRRTLNCPDNYWEGIFTEHTLEHLHYSDCLKLFKELRRTMKAGAWMRICVPGLEQYLSQWREYGTTRAEQVYNLTQNFGHASVWDADLMFEVLRDAGFTTMREASYLQGADSRLIRDSAGRSVRSLYVEVQK
jgi:predicted SAM-dependent methyltransferase